MCGQTPQSSYETVRCSIMKCNLVEIVEIPPGCWIKHSMLKRCRELIV